MKKWILVLCFLLGGSIGFAGNGGFIATRHVEQCYEQAFNTQDYKTALAHINVLLAIQPGNIDYLRKKAKTLSLINRRPERPPVNRRGNYDNTTDLITIQYIQRCCSKAFNAHNYDNALAHVNTLLALQPGSINYMGEKAKALLATLEHIKQKLSMFFDIFINLRYYTNNNFTNNKIFLC